MKERFSNYLIQGKTGEILPNIVREVKLEGNSYHKQGDGAPCKA
jgi:hypothetical protein